MGIEGRPTGHQVGRIIKKKESTKIVKDCEEVITEASLSAANACFVRTRIYRPGHLTAPERPSKNGLMVILAEGKYDELFSRRASERVNTLALDPG